MTVIERNILLNQYVIMSALETLIAKNNQFHNFQFHNFESEQLKERMEETAKVL